MGQNNSKKYWLETYGCQMNMAESSALEYKLSQFGWEAAKEDRDADLVILNTCAVRKSAEKRIWGRIAYFKTFRRNRIKIAVMGCMAERLQEKMQMMEPAIDIVVGNFSKQSFIDMLQNDSLTQKSLDDKVHDDSEEKLFHFAENHGSQSSGSAFVPIMHGCNNFCTYCIVPYVRGREVSRPVDSIILELKNLADKGMKEVTLLGQNVNSYRFDQDGVIIDFPKLLEIVCQKIEIPWIRFTSSHPKDMTPELAQVMADQPKICNHMHLPMQHGSDVVLKRMNRKYTIAHYQSSIRILREKNPGIGLSTDLLIGFPGETEDDFNQTLALVKEIRFDDAFTYYYNVRSGTKAAEMTDQLDESVKKERLAQLIDIQRAIAEENKLKEIGQEVTVLIEKVSRKNKGEWLGRSERNRMVVFASDQVSVGEFCQVRLVSLEGSTFKAEVIE